MKRQVLLAFGAAALCLGIAAAQGKKKTASAAPTDIPALVLQGKPAEAARAAAKTPGGVEAALAQLLASADLKVTARKVSESEAELKAALSFLDECEKLNKKNAVSRDPIRGRQLRIEGILLSDKQNYALAESKLRQALDIAQKAKDVSLEAGVHNNLGVARQNLQKLDEATADFDQARQMVESLKDDSRAGSYNLNLGRILLQTFKPEKALEAFRRAEIQNRAAGQTSLEAQSLFFQGMALSRINSVSAEAMKFYTRAREMFEKLGDDRNTGLALYWMGDHTAYSFKWTDAIRYSEMAVPYLKKANDNEGLRRCYDFLSEMYRRVPDQAKSDQYKKLSEELAPKK